MASKQTVTERSLRHLIRRATANRDWSFVEACFRELGRHWEEAELAQPQPV